MGCGTWSLAEKVKFGHRHEGEGGSRTDAGWTANVCVSVEVA